MKTEEYWIATSQLEALSKVSDKISKKAKKLGNGFVAIEITNETKKETFTTESGTKYAMEYVKVFVQGEPPIINGWQLIGIITPAKTGNMIQRCSDIEIPERFFDTEPFCDHCKTCRFRKELFIIKKEQEYQQVGRNCLADFLGHDPHSLISYILCYNQANALLGENEDGEKSPRTYFLHFMTFLTQTIAFVQADGYRSRGSAREHGDCEATADAVIDWLFKPDQFKTGEEKERYLVTQEHTDLANRMVSWIDSKTVADKSDCDYMHNLKNLVASEYFPPRMYGYVASIPSAYFRECGEEAQKKKRVNFSDSYFGELNKRYDNLELTLLGFAAIETVYGAMNIYRFIGPENCSFVWKTSTGEFDDEDIGKTFTVKATVKGHGAYKGKKQTQLSRIKVT